MYVYIIFRTGNVLSTASSSGGIHPGAVIGIDTCLQAVCKETIPIVLSNWIKTCWELVMLSVGQAQYRRCWRMSLLSPLHRHMFSSQIWLIIFLHLCTKIRQLISMPRRKLWQFVSNFSIEEQFCWCKSCCAMRWFSIVEKKLVEMLPPCLAFHMSRTNCFSEWFHKSLCFWLSLRP